MEEKSMQPSLDTSMSMLPPPVSCRAHFALQKQPQSKIKHFIIFFAFRCILTGPKGFAEAMGFSTSEAMGSSGVQHFHLALGTGCMIS